MIILTPRDRLRGRLRLASAAGRATQFPGRAARFRIFQDAESWLEWRRQRGVALRRYVATIDVLYADLPK